MYMGHWVSNANKRLQISLGVKCIGIISVICMPGCQMQRRLNPNMKEVVKEKVLKLLDAGIIYPISNFKWVSLT